MPGRSRRNITVVADSDGKGLLLGFLFASEQVDLVGAAVAGQQESGDYGLPVVVEVSGEVGVQEPLELGGESSFVEGADLQPGLLAAVVLEFSDGTTISVETPVIDVDEARYTVAWLDALGIEAERS